MRKAFALAIAATVSGCSLLLDLDGLTQNFDAGADGGAGIDAPVDVFQKDASDAGAEAEAEADADGGDCSGAVLCDDFDNRLNAVGAANVGSWASQMGVAKIAAGQGRNGTSALVVSGATGGKSFLTSENLAPGKLGRFTVDLYIYIGKTTYTTPDARALVSIYPDGTYTTGIFGLYVGDQGIYLASADMASNDPVPSPTGLPLTFPTTAAWHHVQMQITYSTQASQGECLAWLDDVQVLQSVKYKSLSTPLSFVTVALQSDAISGNPPALDVRFDDVKVLVE